MIRLALTLILAVSEDPHTVVRSMTPSSYCISCHDGSSMPIRVSDTHPLGVHPVGYGFRLKLSEAIVLVDGAVACTSCHDGKSKLPHMLAMTQTGSTLCLGCHAK